ncbi:conserved hypothetical protein [metagenome]|uniref:DUF881 domain-containing protein n=1 Tax=metagenome TaxID=256318 RepID=A0A2P2C1N3_9ZZZZ
MPSDPAPDSVTDGAQARAQRVRRLWRVGTPLVVLMCGTLFVVSAESSEGTDLRPGRYTDLASIVSAESTAVEGLKARSANLNQEVQELTAGVGDKTVDKINGEVRQLKAPAGRSAVSGSGVTVTLTDSPSSVEATSEIQDRLLVVHQQDIQAVVNAMWLGGAEAVTIQGQRVISTTGIKCSGNAVRLHGIPYAQPYVISAVGSQASIYNSLLASDYLAVYRGQAEDPEIAIGWGVEFEDTLKAPAYDAPIEMSYASVMP